MDNKIFNIVCIICFILSIISTSILTNKITILESKTSDFIDYQQTNEVRMLAYKTTFELEDKTLHSRVDTLEQIVDKTNRRKVLINKVVAAIKQSLPPSVSCPDTLNTGELITLASAIVDNSERYAVPANLILGVIRQESAFCQKAISPVGAQGYMQVMPDTAAQVSKELGIHLNIWSGRDNVHLGTAYLSYLMNVFNGDIKLVLLAYNAGPNHVKKVLAQITKEYHAESVDYEKKVQEYRKFFEMAGVTW